MNTSAASLTRRARPAAVWVFVGMALTNAIRLLSNLLLTHLLAPDLYGLMTVGNVIVAALIMLSDIGLIQSVLQNPRGAESKFLNTVWSIRLLRGVMLAGILLAIAAFFAGAGHFFPGRITGTYGDGRLVTVLLVLALFPIADGFESPNLLLCRRAVNPKPIVLIDVGSQLLATLLMALAAWWHPTVWVLPAGWVCYSLFKSLGSLIIAGPSSKLEWESSYVNEIWHFSKWIMMSSALTFVYREGDRLLLAGLFSASEMGIYGVSMLLLGAVKQVLGNLTATVGLPALAEIARTDPSRLRSAYRRCRTPIDLMCLSIAGLMFGGADLIIHVLYDHRYQGAVPIFRLLALILVAQRYSVFDDFLVATGDTRQLFKRGVLQTVVLISALPIGYHFGGMTGAVWSVLLANFSTIPLILFLEARKGLFDWRAELRVLPILPIAAAIAYLPRFFGFV